MFSADTVQLAVDGIKTVGDVRVNQRAVMIEQRLKGKGQNFIRAIAHKYMIPTNTVVVGNGLAQGGRVRVRVKAQVTACGGMNGG